MIEKAAVYIFPASTTPFGVAMSHSAYGPKAGRAPASHSFDTIDAGGPSDP